MNKKLIKRILTWAFIDAIGIAIYIILIASFIFSIQNSAPQEDNILTISSILLLLVCSAAITGFSVFGKPIMFYIDGKKKESILLFIYTIGMLIMITIIFFILLILK